MIWLTFIGPDRRLVKMFSQVPVGPRPQSRVLTDLMSSLRTLLTDTVPAGSTVALLLTGPGRGPVSAADRVWSRQLVEVALRFDVPLEPIFRANDEALMPVSPCWQGISPLAATSPAGYVGSMAEVRIHKDERMMTRAEAAADLRRLADELEAGVISYGAGGGLTVPEVLEREIEIEREDKGTTVKYEVEVELQWSTTETA